MVSCRILVVLILFLCLVTTAHADPEASNRGSPSVPTVSLAAGQRLAVIGVQLGRGKLRRQDRKRMQQHQTAFGLNNLLAEALYDTEKFRLIEEKEVAQRELLEDLVQTYWIEQREPYPEQALRHIATQLDADLLAYGNISHEQTSGSTLSIGPFSNKTQKLRVALEVCLYAVSSQTRLCHTGQGEAVQQGSGVIYEFHGNRLDFEKNATGIATKQAVDQAVDQLLASIRFTP